MQRTMVWKLASAALVLPVVAVACSSGVSKEDYDAAQAKTAAEQQKSAALQQQLTAAQAQVADLQKKASANQGATALVYAKTVPTATPKPPPTPLPAGFVPPPPAKPDAALIDEVVPFAIYVETLATSSISQYGMASFGANEFSACSPNAIFKRGTKLVWRYEIIDTKTGKRLTNQDGTVTKIILPGGKEVNANYSKRGGVGPWMWAAGWDIPLDYQLGALDWAIRVTAKDGRSTTWRVPFLVKPESPTSRSEDSRVQIIA